MGIARKLEEVRRDIAFLARQGKAEGFLNNVENVDKIGGMVEDIRDAIMEYQVRISYHSFSPRLTFAVDVAATRYLQQELPTHRRSHPLAHAFTA